jgi:hypothetical protein
MVFEVDPNILEKVKTHPCYAKLNVLFDSIDDRTKSNADADKEANDAFYQEVWRTVSEAWHHNLTPTWGRVYDKEAEQLDAEEKKAFLEAADKLSAEEKEALARLMAGKTESERASFLRSAANLTREQLLEKMQEAATQAFYSWWMWLSARLISALGLQGVVEDLIPESTPEGMPPSDLRVLTANLCSGIVEKRHALLNQTFKEGLSPKDKSEALEKRERDLKELDTVAKKNMLSVLEAWSNWVSTQENAAIDVIDVFSRRAKGFAMKSDTGICTLINRCIESGKSRESKMAHQVILAQYSMFAASAQSYKGDAFLKKLRAEQCEMLLKPYHVLSGYVSERRTQALLAATLRKHKNAVAQLYIELERGATNEDTKDTIQFAGVSMPLNSMPLNKPLSVSEKLNSLRPGLSQRMDDRSKFAGAAVAEFKGLCDDLEKGCVRALLLQQQQQQQRACVLIRTMMHFGAGDDK